MPIVSLQTMGSKMMPKSIILLATVISGGRKSRKEVKIPVLNACERLGNALMRLTRKKIVLPKN